MLATATIRIQYFALQPYNNKVEKKSYWQYSFLCVAVEIYITTCHLSREKATLQYVT